MSFLKKIKKFAGTAVGAAAAPFTGGLSLAAGAVYDYMNYNKRMQEKQNKANQAAIDRANAYDMYTWDLANQYNNPRAQAQRLLDAGFNPYMQGGVSSGNATSTAGSNGVAEQGVYNGAQDVFSKGLMVAQAGANIANTKANTDFTDLQRKALDHNLTWAVDHDLPVGQQTDWQKDVYRTGKDVVSDLGKKALDKMTNWWNNKSSSAKSYRERNADRSTWDLVKEQAGDMYQRYKFW